MVSVQIIPDVTGWEYSGEEVVRGQTANVWVFTERCASAAHLQARFSGFGHARPLGPKHLCDNWSSSQTLISKPA